MTQSEVTTTDSRNEPTSTEPAEPQQAAARRWAVIAVERYSVLIVLVALIVLFSVLRPETFPTYRNLSAILSTQAIVAILAVGAMIPLVAGQFDLSVGYTLGFTAMEVAVLTSSLHWSSGLAIVATLATGAVIGLVNGLLVQRGRINAFIATLASGTVLSGLTLWISKGTVVSDGIPDFFATLGRQQIFQLPLPVYLAALVSIVFYYVLEHTPVGRYLYAIGGGRDAARLAGLPVPGLTILSFVLSGFLAGVAGVLETATLTSANPSVGAQFLLPAFAAGFLGATSIRPGRFNVLGTILALLLLAVGISGLSQLGAPLWVSPVFQGGALLIAVAMAVRRIRR